MSGCFCYAERCIHGEIIDGVCNANGTHAPAIEWTLKCGHSYHAHCISKWYLQTPTCPECRAPIELPRVETPLVYHGLEDVCKYHPDIYTICTLQDHPFREEECVRNARRDPPLLVLIAAASFLSLFIRVLLRSVFLNLSPSDQVCVFERQ